MKKIDFLKTVCLSFVLLVAFIFAASAQITVIDFENSENDSEWTLLNQTYVNKWYVGSSTTGSYQFADRKLFISNDGTGNQYTLYTSSTTVHAYRAVTIGEFGGTISFEYRVEGEGTGSNKYDYLNVYLLESTATLTAGSFPSSGIVKSILELRLKGASTWNTHTFSDIPEGTYKLVFTWKNDGSGGNQPPAAIDNIVINSFPCALPEVPSANLTASSFLDAGIAKATISWDANSATSWELKYKRSTFSDWYTIPLSGVSSYELTNLQGNGDYDVQLITLCENGQPLDVLTTSFTAACINDRITAGTCYTPNAGALTTSTQIPMNTNFGYSYSQQIHDAATLSCEAGPITKIYFENTGSAALNAGNITIYIGETPKTNFTSTSDWVPVGDMQLVYSQTGDYGLSAGWNEFVLNTPFEYDGTSNLVIAFWENFTGYDGDTRNFTAQTTSTNKAIYYRGDYTAANPASPPSGTLLSAVNYIKLEANTVVCDDEEQCPSPSELAGDIVPGNGRAVNLSWTPGAGETEWVIYHKPIDATTWTTVTTTDNPYVLTDLQNETTHQIKIKTVCGEYMESDYTNTIEFYAVSCRPPENLSAQNVGTSTTVTWEIADESITSFVAEYKLSADEDWISLGTIDALQHQFAVLPANTDYDFRVKSVCAVDDESLWTTFSFTTITCASTPSNIQVSELTSNGGTVTVTWEPQGGEIQWVVEYKLDYLDEWYSFTVNNNPTLSIAPIQGGSKYNIRIKAICAEDYESDFATTTCATPCIVPGGSEDITYYTLENSSSASSSEYIPFYGVYGRTYSEQIYDQVLVGEAGTITAISFYANNIPHSAGSIKIWMGTTTKDRFSGTTDFFTSSALTLVYDGGTADWPTITGWNRIALSTPFEYDGTNNLVIAFYENKNGYNTSSFQAQSTGKMSTIQNFSDTESNVSPTNPAATDGSRSSRNYVNYLKFEKTVTGCTDEELCSTPENFEILPGGNMTIFSWDVEVGSTYQLKYKEVDSTNWQAELMLTESPFELFDMVSGRTYDIQFRKVCGEFSHSDIIEEEFFFATCYPPVNLASYNVGNSTTIHWERSIYGNSSTWTSEYKKDSEATWIPITTSADTFVTVTNLEGNTLYNFRITTTCENLEESIYAEYDFTSITCAATPSNIQVSELASDGGPVTVTWNPQGDEIQWVVEYKLASHEDWYTIIVNNNPTLSIAPIQGGSTYNLRIKAVCMEGYESAFATTIFVTTCFDTEVENDVTFFMPEAGNETTNSGLPITGNYQHSYCQQIYNASVVPGGAGNITQIAYHAAANMTHTGDIKILMGHTSKESFSSETDWVPYADLTEVFVANGAYAITSGWNTFTLSTPFVYDGASNLVIAFLENYTSSTYGSTVAFKAKSASNAALRYYVDGTSQIDITNPSSSSSGYRSRANFVNYVEIVKDATVCIVTELCPTPEIIDYEWIDDQSMKITWNSTDATAWNFNYREQGETVWNEISVTENPYTLTGLELNTYYEIRVKSICGEFNESNYSNTLEVLHARCFMPENLAYETEGIITTVTWEPTASGGGDQWIAQYKKDTDSENAWLSVTTSTPELLLYNLLPSTIYNFRVKSICDIDYESLWAELNISGRTCDIVPTSLTTTNVTTESAQLSWTAPDADRWIVEYSADAGTTWTAVEVTENPYVLTGLTPATSYRWRVRTACEAISYSDYSTTATFTTSAPPCSEARTLPFFEGFEAGTTRPSCWTEEHVIGSTAWEFGKGGRSNSNPSNTYEGNYNARFVTSTEGNTTKLITPQFDLSSYSDVTLEFYHVQTSWLGDIDNLKVYYKNANGGEWVLLQSYTTEVSSWTKREITLPNLTDTYWIAFEGISNYGNSTAIDNISVTAAGGGDPCDAPKTVDYSENFTDVSTSCWTLEGDWTSASGQLTVPSTGAASTLTSPAISIPAGTYELAYDYMGNNLKVMMGTDPSQINTEVANHTATQTEITRAINYITVDADAIYYFEVNATPQDNIVFDNFSIKRVYNVEISYLPTECGTVMPTGSYYVYPNDIISVNIVPVEGSGLSYIENQNGQIVEEANNNNVVVYHHRVIADEQLFVALNPMINTTLTFNDEDNTATITPAGEHNVIYGSTQVYTIETTPGYAPFAVLVTDNQGVTTDRFAELVQTANHVWEFTFENIVNNHDIEVVIEKAIITITTDLIGEGTITPSESFRFDPDYTYYYDIEAAPEYKIVGMILDGETIVLPDLDTYSDSIAKPITIDHSIIAITSDIAIHYNLYGGNCYVNNILRTPEDSPFLKYFSPEAGFRSTFEPIEGYRIERIVVNGIEMGVIDQFYFSGINATQYVDIYVTEEIYTVTTQSYGYGSITAGSSFTYDPDYEFVYDITPEEGYYISSILINGEPADIVDPEGFTDTLSNITQNYLIQVYFSVKTFTVTATAGEGGAINPNGTTVYNWHNSPIYTATAAQGYYISEVLLDGEEQDVIDNQVWRDTITNIEADHDIVVTFERITFTITVTQGANGTITPDTDDNVYYGASKTFTITPAENYVIANVEVDGEDMGAISEYTFIHVTSDHTITATFVKRQYTITAIAYGTGTITPTNSYDAGTSASYIASPNTGSRIVSILVDDVEVNITDPNVNYTVPFNNISSDHTIIAHFETRTFTVTATQPSEGGNITPAGISTVNYGSNMSYTITPDEGYKITGITTNSGAVPNFENYINDLGVATYTFSDITANKTITATLAKKNYTITASAGDNGRITPTGTINVIHGANQNFTITADDNYEIDHIIVDGVTIGNISSNYQFVNVTANHTIRAEFRYIPCEMPSQLYVSDLTTESATLHWTDMGVNEYKVEYKEFDAETYNTVFSSTNEYALTGLTQETSYVWRVMTICDKNDNYESEWTELMPFTTLAPTPEPDGINDNELSQISVYAHLNNVNIVNETGIAIKQVDIYDIYGRQVYNGNVLESKETITLSVTSGTYIVRLVTNQGVATYKVPIIW